MFTFNESKEASQVFNEHNFDALKEFEPPMATGRHRPVPFFDIAEKTNHYLTREITYRDNEDKLQWGRFAVDNQQWRVQGTELYGSIALKVYDRDDNDLNPLSSEAIWSIGIRSSYAKKISLRFLFALRILACLNGMRTNTYEDNVKHKHTININLDNLINTGLEGMIPNLMASGQIVENYKQLELGPKDAEAIMVEAGRNKVIAWSDIGKVDKVFQNPTYEEFKPFRNTGWGLYNAFTEVARDFPSVDKQQGTLEKLPWAFSRAGVIDLKQITTGKHMYN